MSSIAANVEQDSRSKIWISLRAIRAVRLGLDWAADWLNARAWRCILLISIAYLPLALMMAHSQRLSSDELYTYKIAQQPTLASMIQLSRQIDLHPPLHFLLQKAALGLGLPRWLGSRLPSLLAGQVGLLAVFAFFARAFRTRGLGNLTGLLAASVYWLTPATDFSWSNRPYALWLCLLALTALFWQICGEWERPWWAPWALAIAGLAMVLDHMFGLPCLLPFLLAEGVRWSQRRQIDWPAGAALLLPLVAGVTYFEQIRSFATNGFPTTYLPSFAMGIDIYSALLLVPGLAVGACLLAAKVLANDSTELEPASHLPAEDWVMMAALIFLPVLLLCAAAVHQTQFFARYAACGAIGSALLLTALVATYSPRVRVVSVMMTLAMLIAAITRVDGDTVEAFGPWRAQAMGVVPARLEVLDPALPIVVASATEFTELNDREPAAIAQRLYYLTDRDAALTYSGQTVFATEDQTARLLGLSGHAEPMTAFLAVHPRFYVVGDYLSSEEWVLRYLMAHGAVMRYMGKYATTVQSNDLYEVTMSQTMIASSDGTPSRSRTQ